MKDLIVYGLPLLGVAIGFLVVFNNACAARREDKKILKGYKNL